MIRALLLVLCVACTDRGVDVTPAPPALAPPPVASDASSQPDAFVGVLVVAESVEIAPRVAGVLQAVRVNVGDAVTSGQVVVDMDPKLLAEEVRAAQASVSAASAAVRAQVVDVEAKRREAVREDELYKKGLTALAGAERARADLDRAAAALQQARSTLNIQTSRLQSAREHLTDTSLRAPFAGTVAERHRDAGSRVEAGAPILRIVGNGTMRLRFAVPPDRTKELPVGRAVTARIDTIAAPVEAVVKYISPTVDPPSGLIFIDAELAGASTGLREGLAAWVAPQR